MGDCTGTCCSFPRIDLKRLRQIIYIQTFYLKSAAADLFRTVCLDFWGSHGCQLHVNKLASFLGIGSCVGQVCPGPSSCRRHQQSQSSMVSTKQAYGHLSHGTHAHVPFGHMDGEEDNKCKA